MRLAVIPARGGRNASRARTSSPSCGKPMIAWSIEAARMSGFFDRIIVSTDDAEIADVARAYGAEVPPTRPPELSRRSHRYHPGHCPRHRLDEPPHGCSTFACCIYATAPLRPTRRLASGLTCCSKAAQITLFSVTSYAFPSSAPFASLPISG